MSLFLFVVLNNFSMGLWALLLITENYNNHKAHDVDFIIMVQKLNLGKAGRHYLKITRSQTS